MRRKKFLLLINGESSRVILIGHESGRKKYIEVLKDRKEENISCTFSLSIETRKNPTPFKVNERINGDKF